MLFTLFFVLYLIFCFIDFWVKVSKIIIFIFLCFYIIFFYVRVYNILFFFFELVWRWTHFVSIFLLNILKNLERKCKILSDCRLYYYIVVIFHKNTSRNKKKKFFFFWTKSFCERKSIRRRRKRSLQGKKMGEYTVSSRSFDETKHCRECGKMYDAGYVFMYLSCACGCDTSFEICSICSPMYMKCDCGCKGVYVECTQRPEYGNLRVSNKYK